MFRKMFTKLLNDDLLLDKWTILILSIMLVTNAGVDVFNNFSLPKAIFFCSWLYVTIVAFILFKRVAFPKK